MLASGPDMVMLVDPPDPRSSTMNTSDSVLDETFTVEFVIWTRGLVVVVVRTPSISSSPPPWLITVLLFVAIKATPGVVPPEKSSPERNVKFSSLVVPVTFKVLLSSRRKGSLAARVKVKLSTSVVREGSSSMTLKVTVVSFRSSIVPVKLNVFPLSSMSTSESAVNEPPVILITGPTVFVRVLLLLMSSSVLALMVLLTEVNIDPPVIRLALVRNKRAAVVVT